MSKISPFTKNSYLDYDMFVIARSFVITESWKCGNTAVYFISKRESQISGVFQDFVWAETKAAGRDSGVKQQKR